MDQGNHPANKLIAHVKKYGIKGLLPQNLTDELLDRMNLEGNTIDEDRTEEIPMSVVLLAILHLISGPKISKNMEIRIEPELLMEHFYSYIALLKIEDMRRKKDIEVSNESLPTLENIFDSKRSIDITVLK